MFHLQKVHSSSWITREILQLGSWCRTRAGVKQWMGTDTSMSSKAEYLEALCLLPWLGGNNSPGLNCCRYSRPHSQRGRARCTRYRQSRRWGCRLSRGSYNGSCTPRCGAQSQSYNRKNKYKCVVLSIITMHLIWEIFWGIITWRYYLGISKETLSV